MLKKLFVNPGSTCIPVFLPSGNKHRPRSGRFKFLAVIGSDWQESLPITATFPPSLQRSFDCASGIVRVRFGNPSTSVRQAFGKGSANLRLVPGIGSRSLPQGFGTYPNPGRYPPEPVPKLSWISSGAVPEQLRSRSISAPSVRFPDVPIRGRCGRNNQAPPICGEQAFR